MNTAITTATPVRRRNMPRQLTVEERAEARRRRYHRGSIILDSMALLVPLSMAFQIEVIGRLFAAEFILLLALPLLLIDRGRMLGESLPKMVLLLGAAWLASQIVTDLVNATPYADYSRGWSKIVFFMINFAAIYMIIFGNRRRLLLFVVGMAIGLAISNIVYPTPITSASPWKFAYGLSVSLLIVAMFQAPLLERAPILSVLVMAGVGVLNMYLGWRSMAGVCFMAALYLIVQRMFGKKGANVTPPTNTRLFFILLLGIAAVWALLAAYEFAALEGYLGDEARDKLIDQTSGGMGILLGGRHEIIVSIQAIADSPILGHGSWAKDPQYIDMLIAMTRDSGDELGPTWFGDLIPTHSHLTGAWVEAGVVGGVFWIAILFLGMKVLANLFQARDRLSPLAVFVALLMVWDVLFSPFGADRRIVVAYEIVLMIFMWDILKRYADRAKQIRRIRRAARQALTSRGGIAVRPGSRPLPNPRLMRRPPPNVATLPRPSARAAVRDDSGPRQTTKLDDEDA